MGSSLLFLAMLFIAAAVFGAMVTVHAVRPDLANSTTFSLARSFAYAVVNVYAVKMAGVFMMVTSTLGLRTGFVARWISVMGLVMALLLLFGSQLVDWSFAIFPAWVLAISVYMFFTNVPARQQV
jgi:hypothetical protein